MMVGAEGALADSGGLVQEGNDLIGASAVVIEALADAEAYRRKRAGTRGAD